MANKIYFTLKEANSKEETLIFLQYKCIDGKLKWSTQQVIKPTDWNRQVQRSFTKQRVNDELNRFFRIAEAFIESQKKLGIHEVTKQDLKRELDQKDHRLKEVKDTPAPVEAPKNIFEYIDILIKEAKDGTILVPKKGTKYSPATPKCWNYSKAILKEFNPEMTFDNVTLEMYFEFINFCHAKNFAKNYTGRTIKDWKSFMAWGQVKKWHNNMIYKHPQFVKLAEDADTVYLDEEEILTLLNYDLSGDPYWEKIRDRFVVNLYTGLRVSDMKTLSTDNIDEEDDTIVHINQKTSKGVVIPVHPIVQQIRDKYKGDLPKQYADQVVNREIKEICKKAGFTKKIRYTRTEGGVVKKYVKEKWQLITNHTCRRSLTTNLLKHTDIQSAMPVTGMSLKTLMKYNKRSAKENAEMLKNNPFFKKS